MAILKYLVLGLVGLVLLLIVVGLFLPSEYSAARSTTVGAPAEIVFEQVNDLTKNEAWSPWAEMDPTIDITYGDVVSGEGASYSWTSEKSGEGTLVISESVRYSSITIDLDFGEQGLAVGSWTFEETADGTEVTWGFSGDAGGNIMGRYFGLMMDTMIGEPFELGLAKLKEVSEAAAKEAEEAAAAAEAAQMEAEAEAMEAESGE